MVLEEDLSLKSDGVYRPQTSGTYGGVVVKEGYYTLLRKKDGVWSLESEVKMPTVAVDKELNDNSENAIANNTVYNTILNRKLDGYELDLPINYTADSYRDIRTGVINSNLNYRLSNFIDVSNLEKLIVKTSFSTTRGICGFDENENIIFKGGSTFFGTSVDEFKEVTFTRLSNVKFIEISPRKTETTAICFSTSSFFIC